jgi:long-chain acyl-CoA synthetase
MKKNKINREYYMNIYEELNTGTKFSEKDLYQKLYKTIIMTDQITYVGQILHYASKKFGKQNALICGDKTVTYNELYYYACRVTDKLKERGISKGDRVLMLIENSIEFYAIYFGILQVGAVVVPLNTFLHEHELIHIINDAKPALFVCSSSRIEKIRNFAAELPPLADETLVDLTMPVPSFFSECEVIKLPFEDMAALLYTSGTTGFPKGVMLSSKNILTNVLQVATRFGIIKPQRVIAILPLFHSLAQNVCIWTSMIMGCTIIFVPKLERRAILTGLMHAPTIFVGVPALFGVLCLLKTAPLDTVSYFFSGGDALPDKIRAAFSLVYRRKISSGYGITEASPVVSADMEDKTVPTNSAGRVLEGVICCIFDEKGNQLPKNTIGEIRVKGDTIMLGYYNAPDLNEKVFTDGWFCTGDLGYFDDDEKLIITGRIKDLIINKGIKIYPQEVENVILLHPQVIAVGVIGAEDPEVGQLPVAYVQVRQMEPSIEQVLKTLCLQHLAPYKVPRQFFCSTKQLATTATGKVDKKVLRKEHAGK